MVFEEVLADYGVLGIWTISLLFEKYKHQRDMKNVIQHNTEALTKVYEVIQKCKKR